MLPDIKTNILVDFWILHGVDNINSSLVVNSWTKQQADKTCKVFNIQAFC